MAITNPRTQILDKQIDGRGSYVVVAADGSGHYDDLIDAINTELDNTNIYIKNGTYSINAAVTLKPGMSITGESRAGVVLDYGSVVGGYLFLNEHTFIKNITIANGILDSTTPNRTGLITAFLIDNLGTYENIDFLNCKAGKNALFYCYAASSAILDYQIPLLHNIRFIGATEINGTLTGIAGNAPSLLYLDNTHLDGMYVESVSSSSPTGDGGVLILGGGHNIIENVRAPLSLKNGTILPHLDCYNSIVSNWWITNEGQSIVETVASSRPVFKVNYRTRLARIFGFDYSLTMAPARTVPFIQINSGDLTDSDLQGFAGTSTAPVVSFGSSVHLTNNNIVFSPTATGGVAFSTLSSGSISDSIISSNTIRDADTGISIGATCQNNIVTSNRVRGAVTPIVDLGTGTVNVANNIAP